MIRSPDHKTTYRTSPTQLLEANYPGIDTTNFEPWEWEEAFPNGVQVTPGGIKQEIARIKSQPKES